MPGLDLPTALRVMAFAFVLVGFLGSVAADASPIAGESAFSLLFFAGVGCAVASVYLAIYRRRPGDSDGDSEAGSE